MNRTGRDEHRPAPAIDAKTRRSGRRLRLAVGRLGPGLITGAADDDPSGIATYSQAGARFGLNMLWSAFILYPLQVAVQLTCARIGRVTGKGLTANLRQILPNWAVASLVMSLFVANTVNIGADLAAIGAALELLFGRSQLVFTIVAGIGSTLLQLFVPYHFYVRYLKWLTLVLLTYAGVVFTVAIDWSAVATSIVLPHISPSAEWFTVVLAIFGTTISPYLMFWQPSEEVEEQDLKHRLDLRHTSQPAARHELRRMRTDTFVGMAICNIVFFFIILTTAVTLHQAGVTSIATSAEAAEALRPIAGSFAFLLFSLGIIGTGLLAVPVLAGSTAYAAAELMDWNKGLEKKVREAKAFYAVIAASMAIALGIVFSPLNPIQALFWTAVLNGIISVPILSAAMVLAGRSDVMGEYVAARWQRALGWIASGLMAAASVAMVALTLF